MDQAAATTLTERDERFAACLGKLEELKAVKARREVLEERVFLEFLRANRNRISEFPLLETEQQSLMDMLLRRAEGVHPGHDYLREQFSEYLIELNHYAKAKSLGNSAQQEELAGQLERVETILAKAMQGAIYATSLIKDNFSDAVIRHFGESSLVKIDEITATMVFDEQYWRAYLDRFIKEEVRGAYDSLLAERNYRLLREGQQLIFAVPFDAVLSKIKGTTKAISQTRVQSTFAAGAESEEGRQRVETALALFAKSDLPLWEKQIDRDDLPFAAQVAAMDVVASDYLTAAPGADEGILDVEAKRAYLAELIVALCVGAAVSLRMVREDFARALRDFSAKETTWLIQSAGTFDAAHLGGMLENLMELDFAYLLREKGEADAGRIQIKITRVRRASRAAIEALAEAGFNKIRRKQFFDDDAENEAYALFRSKTPAEFQELLQLFQIEPELARSLVGLWESASFKVDLFVCINLLALGKVVTNLSARVAEILGRYGVAPSGAAAPVRTRREA